jgi:hypothetical protein
MFYRRPLQTHYKKTRFGCCVIAIGIYADDNNSVLLSSTELASCHHTEGSNNCKSIYWHTSVNDVNVITKGAYTLDCIKHIRVGSRFREGEAGL